MKFSVTVAVSTVFTTVVTTSVVVPVTSVKVVTPVPMVLVRVRVGGLVVDNQLFTDIRHWHCNAGSVERPSYSWRTMAGKLLVAPQVTFAG